MSSPLVRAWLAARLPDWADHAYACWRATLHGLTCRPCRQGQLQYCPREWDPCQVEARYLVEAAYLNAVAPPTFHTMLPCPVCNAGVGKDCVTADKTVTGPHKARREAAAAQQVTS